MNNAIIYFSDGTEMNVTRSFCVDSSFKFTDQYEWFPDCEFHFFAHSHTIPIILTPEGDRAVREYLFFGKHLKPAPAHIEQLLMQREAWATVYHTCHAKVDEVLNLHFSGEITQSTTTEAISWLSRVMSRACDRMEHYDECYMLEFTIDEDFSDA